MTTVPSPAHETGAWPAADVLNAVSRCSGVAVQRMLDAFVAEIAFYRRLPVEQLQVDVPQVCRENIVSFLRCCREKRLPRQAELMAARAGATRRAEEGVPLDAVVMAYTIGNRVLWQVLAEQVPPGREAEVATFTPYVFRYMHTILEAVTQTYVEERRAIEYDDGSTGQTMVQSLLGGHPDHALAQRLGVTLAAAYSVVAIHLDDHTDEQSATVEAGVAARRKVRRVQLAVSRLPGHWSSLSLLGPSGGLVLLPAIGTRLPGRTESERTLRTLAEAAGTPVTAVSVPAQLVAELPDAASLARELVQLARALGRPPGLYTLDDLVLEYQLSLAGPARRHLANKMRPLVQHGDLLPTARAWLRNERARRETAEELHVHPNTVDQRLERITQLTGIHLATTRGVALLQAGLVAMELESRSTAGAA